MSEMTPFSLSVRALTMYSMASAWFLSGALNTISPLAEDCLTLLPSMPMRSAWPLAMTLSSSMSMSWYLMEDEPALMTRIFMCFLPLFSENQGKRGGVFPPFPPDVLFLSVFYFCWACTAVSAHRETMSSTEQPRDRSLTGRARPCMTGPMASAPARRCTSL